MGTIVANDLLPTAVEAIERNVKDNGVEGVVTPSTGDARLGPAFRVGDVKNGGN